MNVNSLLKTPTIEAWIKDSTVQLAGIGIGTAKLDAELILSHTLKKSRTWIHMYHEEELTPRLKEIADSRLALRLDRVPLAYIIGHKEFYGRRFRVSPNVLVPRPESEALIERLKALLPSSAALLKDGKRLVDVGSGSGCLGITAKLEHPELDVTLIDASPAALKVAASNAETLHAEARIVKSDLLTEYPFRPDIVMANLPYVDKDWDRSPETNHEPSEALFADNRGLALIQRLIDQCDVRMQHGALLLLEADPFQHDEIIHYAKTRNFSHQTTNDYALIFTKR